MLAKSASDLAVGRAVQGHLSGSPIDGLDRQQVAGASLQHVVVVDDLHPVPRRQAEAIVPAQVLEGHRRGSTSTPDGAGDGEYDRTVLARPLERRGELTAGGRRRLAWQLTNPRAGPMNLDAVELILRPTVARIWGNNAGVR